MNQNSMNQAKINKVSGIVKKTLFSATLLALCCNAFAYKVTITNSTPTTVKTHGALIVLRSFFPIKGMGQIHYLTNTTPTVYHQMSSSVFNAFSSFHTSAAEFGNALISPGIITVGNVKTGNKINFVVVLAERGGKSKIGPMKCTTNKNEQCYEFPQTTVKVLINGKAYPDLINNGQIVLPKGNGYDVNLSVSVNVPQTEAAKVGKETKQAASAAIVVDQKAMPKL